MIDWITGLWLFSGLSWVLSKYMIARNNRLAKETAERDSQHQRFMSGESYNVWQRPDPIRLPPGQTLSQYKWQQTIQEQRQQQAAEGDE